MKSSDDIDDAITRVLEAPTSNFDELTRIAGLNPSIDFRFANLSNMDFSGADLAGFDFTGAMFEGAIFQGAKIVGAKFGRSHRLLPQLRKALDAKEYFSSIHSEGALRKDDRRRVGRAQRTLGQVPDEVDDEPNLQNLSVSLRPVAEPQLNFSEENLPAILRWLDHNLRSDDAIKVLHELLNRYSSLEEPRQLALRWLDANIHSPHAVGLLQQFLQSSPVEVEIIRRAIHWLEANPNDGRGAALWIALIKIVDIQTIRTQALRWLSGTTRKGAAAHVVTALVHVGARDKEIRDRLLQWIDTAFDLPSVVHPLIALLIEVDYDDAVRQRVIRWIEANATRPAAVSLISQLLRVSGSDEMTQRYAVSWLRANGNQTSIPRNIAQFKSDLFF